MDRVESRDVSQEVSVLSASDRSSGYFGIFFAIEPGVTSVVAVRDMRDDPKDTETFA